MIEIPWWAFSPSPFTFAVWFFLAMYGFFKFHPKSLRDGILAFSTSAFVVGLTVLPFDLLWTISQALTFGHLHPLDLAELLPLFNLKLVVWILCLYECRNLFRPKGHLIRDNLFLLALYIPFLIFWFKLAPDPSWSDWTYAWRFGYGTARIIEAFFISHIFGKVLQAIIYINLWKDQK